MNTDSYESAPAVAIREMLGPVRQLGYVVADIEAAATDWVSRLGIGPWRIKHGITFGDCQYMGNPVDVEVGIATAFSGGFELKLMAQTRGPKTMYSDFFDSSGPGAQHVCFYPTDFAAARDLMVATGSSVVFSGLVGATDFAYLDDGAGQVVELAAVPADRLGSRTQRASAATTWDGTNPLEVVT